MIVGLGLDISVCEKEDGENNRNDVPAGENQSGTKSPKSSASIPIPYA